MVPVPDFAAVVLAAAVLAAALLAAAVLAAAVLAAALLTAATVLAAGAAEDAAGAAELAVEAADPQPDRTPASIAVQSKALINFFFIRISSLFDITYHI